MKFSKAIKIKKLVTSWNKDRVTFDSGHVECEFMMFSLGHWSVTLRPVGTKLFFTMELDELMKLYAEGGLQFIIGSTGSAPYIDMQ